MTFVNQEKRPQPKAIALRVMAALSASLVSAGCMSFSLGESRQPIKRPGIPTVSIDASAANEIDEISPVVNRTGPRSAEIKFIVRGSITEVEERVTMIDHSEEQRLAVGFFPGAACEKTTDDAMVWGAETIWYNIIFVGLPTVSGLLIEPFIPAGRGNGSAFSRSAIIGFHRWGSEPHTETSHERRSYGKDSTQLKGYLCTAEGASTLVDRQGLCTVRDFPATAKSLKVTLSIPNAHPLKRQLEPFERGPISIQLPEK